MIDIDPSKFFIAISGVIIGFFLNVFEKVIGYRFVKRDDRKTIACILLYVLKDLEITDIHNNKVAFAVDYNGTLVKTITRDFYNESGGCCRCFQ